MFLLIFLLACTSYLIFKFLKSQRSDYWKRQNIVQVTGVLKDFMLGNCSLAEIYKKIYDKYPTEPNVGFAIGLRPALLLKDVENVQAVLAGDFQSFYSRGLSLNRKEVLADNVLFIDNFGRWKVIRQKLSPVFTGAKLKNMFYILNRCGRDFVARIEEDPKSFDLPFDALSTYTTASIAASVFGIDAQIKNTMDSPFLTMSRKAVEPTLKTNLIFAIGNLFPRIVSMLNLRRFSEQEKFFVGVVRNVIESRRKSEEKRFDFIDICLELQDEGLLKDATTGYELKPTVEVLAAQAFFFFIAGADTSANTMHFTLLELSNNPDILEKVHKEIDKVFDGCDKDLTYNDVEKLNYLDMVISEGIRKYPPIGLIQRMCTRDTVLPVGEVKMKKDFLAVIPVYAIHRDQKYYPDPEKFDPERFSPENFEKIPKGAYLPFGDGNRNCLGMRYAKLQVKAGLAWLLRRYTLKQQSFTPKTFERSFFALRDPRIRYELLPRDL